MSRTRSGTIYNPNSVTESTAVVLFEPEQPEPPVQTAATVLQQLGDSLVLLMAPAFPILRIVWAFFSIFLETVDETFRSAIRYIVQKAKRLYRSLPTFHEFCERYLAYLFCVMIFCCLLFLFIQKKWYAVIVSAIVTLLNKTDTVVEDAAEDIEPELNFTLPETTHVVEDEWKFTKPLKTGGLSVFIFMTLYTLQGNLAYM